MKVPATPPVNLLNKILRYRTWTTKITAYAPSK
nr:MAG TPA: hypothetical protein [Caudoviricetes sp.]